MKKLSLNVRCMLQLMMDGPNTNKSFEGMLKKTLDEEYSTSLIEIGSCMLHHAHNAFQAGLKRILFDFDGFASDLAFFEKKQLQKKKILKVPSL